MLLAYNPSPSTFSPDRHSSLSDHSHRPSTSQQPPNSHPQPQSPSAGSPTLASPTGKEWRISVGLTNDVQFVPAKNASVLGAGIDGKYKPISDSDMEMSDSDVDVATLGSKPNGKGKSKATDEDIKMTEDNTQPPSKSLRSTPAPSASSGAAGSSTSDVATVSPEQRLRRRLPSHWPAGLNLGRGFMNTGNTCFLNSVLQSLLYTRPLLHALRNHSSCSISGFCAICELRKVMEANFFSNQRGWYNPRNITGKLPIIAKGMRLGRQEDAHEFLRYIIDACQKVCLQKYPQKERSKHTEKTWVYDIFGGKTRSRVSCTRCGHNSDTFETCLDLSLDLSHHVTTVEDALAAFVKPERLGGKGDDRYKCEKCKVPVDAEKQFTIETAPQILTVHLKRFTVTGRKIGRPISYPTTLDLGPYVSEESGPMMYTLYGIIAHSGSGPHSGHYFAHIKGPDDRWHEMNDEDVSQGTSSPPLNMREAYILFYIQSPSARLSGKPTPKLSKPGLINGRESSTPPQSSPTSAEKVFGSPEIAAASEREQEKSQVLQKTLSIKINQAEFLKKAGAATPVTSNVTASAVQPASRSLLGFGFADDSGNEEDIGEKVDTPASLVTAQSASAPNFIGPQLPPGQTSALQPPVRSSTSILADSVDKMNLLSPINSSSFYGESKSNPKKRGSSPALNGDFEEASARKKKRSSGLMSGVSSDTLWSSKNRDDATHKLGYPGGPPQRFKPWKSDGGIKNGMQKKEKHKRKSLM